MNNFEISFLDRNSITLIYVV